MLSRNDPDRIRIVFDDHRSVANAGLLLPAVGHGAHVKRVGAAGEGAMSTLRKARVVMEVSKSDLALGPSPRSSMIFCAAFSSPLYAAI